MLKILIGGSPCTHWSIAQKNNRETQPEGLGWELFKNYLIAKEKFKPDLFLYENNKSAAQAIKDQISKELDVPLMYIDSALVSAQRRQRFYAFNWEVDLPEDRGILLRDILETGVVDRDKAHCLCSNHVGTTRDYFKKGQSQNAFEPINTTDDGEKARTLMAGYYKYGTATLLTNKGFKGGTTAVAEPVRVGALPRPNGEPSTSQAMRVYSDEGKSVTLSACGGGMGGKTGLYAIPTMRVPEATKKGYVDVEAGECVDLTQPNSKTRRGRSMAQKANCPTTSCSFYEYCGTVDKPIYKVEGGLITIKGKQYPIKLKDGCYIIRKLTPVECERLQTIPDGYTEGVSDSQRYKGLGNGWTAEVIIHILNGALKDVPRDEEIVVLSMYDGIGTGRYCLDKMGFTNVKYYAYEIDPYPIKIAMKNYPDIIQMGDAFDLRNPDWTLEEVKK